jgi:hypothetical protein
LARDPTQQHAQVQPMLQQLTAGEPLRVCTLLMLSQQLDARAAAVARLLPEQRTVLWRVTKGLRCGLLSCS